MFWNIRSEWEYLFFALQIKFSLFCFSFHLKKNPSDVIGQCKFYYLEIDANAN